MYALCMFHSLPHARFLHDFNSFESSKSLSWCQIMCTCLRDHISMVLKYLKVGYTRAGDSLIVAGVEIQPNELQSEIMRMKRTLALEIFAYRCPGHELPMNFIPCFTLVSLCP